jgi:hypothetical protein
MDLGFTTSPTALTQVRVSNNNLYAKCLIYEPTEDPVYLANLIKALGIQDKPIWTDSAHPLFIAKLKSEGIQSFSIKKMPVVDGISIVKTFKLHFVKNKNVSKEQENYTYMEINGIPTDQPKKGNDHCFKSDTLITTRKGLKEIQYITTKDEVLTRNGFRFVHSAGQTGQKEINKYTIVFDAIRYITIFATDNHLIKTNIGWITIERLYNISTGKDTNYTKGSVISVELQQDYTELFGNTTKVQSKKAITSTISTGTHSIMTLKTSILSMLEHIYRTIKKNGQRITKRRYANTSILFDHSQRNGIQAKKELNGIRNTLRNVISESKITGNTNAMYAEKSLLEHHITIGSVQTNASQVSGVNQALITSSEFANIVEKDLQSINMIEKRTVPLNAIQKVEKTFAGIEKVYDITTNGIPEYYANGLLVHNQINNDIDRILGINK